MSSARLAVAPPAATAVVAAGCALLVLRPVLWSRGDPTVPLAALFVGLLAMGAWWPLAPPAGVPASRALTVTVLLAGVAAFAAGRMLGGGHGPASVSARFVALNSLAAVAEEAFFRRLAFALLDGSAAVVGTSVLFAVAHVGVYGWWVVPLDFAAGVVFAWQRQATGTWAVPAVTHVIANLLVVF